ncbi:MAG: hypothetical protein A3F90_13425 [Deltaproteobacteria bacterium RIFCSPLOWO2_12_FULL_60_19]|nr:MAG: hypothetical protein A3F90_13425 [Deltaproteobacteria bacterium RIFCSPLOWO2_12_FULL_60_19]
MLVEKVRLPVVRWNLTANARLYQQADALVVSIPKSGRTWLRVFLYAYFCRLDDRPFTMRSDALTTGTPRVEFTHDVWLNMTARKIKHWLLGRSVIPPSVRRSKPIILMARDPRDLIVSYFFQLTTRRHGYRRLTLTKLVRHPKFGIRTVVDVMNQWMGEWADRRDFRFLRYEDLKKDPERHFRGVLSFLGFAEVVESALRHALDFSSFENMKAMEATGGFKSRKLTPADGSDPESYKVRKGKVGGYINYLAPEDIAYVNRALAELDPRYGYTVRGQEEPDRSGA